MTLNSILSLLIIIITFFCIADTQITFSPFTFKCLALGKAVGYTLIAAGFVTMNVHNYNRGVRDGAEATKKALMETIDEKFKLDTTSGDEPTDTLQ